MESQISIIVPIYNAASTLERCVRALMGQTHRNIEIILVNDGSSDNSLQLCRQFATEDSRIRVIDKTNGGVSSARNAGLDIASGAFIMFCDSDDWAEPEWCEELISHYEENCLVMCGHFIEGKQSYFPHRFSANSVERYNLQDFYLLKDLFFSCPWNKIFHAETICKNSLRFNTSIHNGEDYIFNLQYINCITGYIVRIPSCSFHYLWPSGHSLSSKIPDNYYLQLKTSFHVITREINKLCIGNKAALLADYSRIFFQYQHAILSELFSHANFIHKIIHTGKVMKTYEYKQCVKHSNISSNKIYSRLWIGGNSFGIWLWHTMTTLLKKEHDHD